MSIVTVTAWELRFEGGGSDKFYRLYVVDNLVLKQWGRRNAVGQFMVDQFRSPALAFQGATKIDDEKRAKGYVPFGGRVTFDYAVNYAVNSVIDLKAHGSYMDDLFRRAARGGFQAGPDDVEEHRAAKDEADAEKFKKLLLRIRSHHGEATPAAVAGGIEEILADAVAKARAKDAR